jgi:photosystem II stability/assembly factor-like uncharacterized protein
MKLISIITAILLISLYVYPADSNPDTPVLKWKIQNSGTDASFRGICAVSPQVAWAGGSKGTIVKTIDGGKKWTTLTIPNTEKLDFRDIQAFDQHNAVVISAGSPAKIFKTSDGGKSWQETYSNTHPNIFFDSMAFWNRKDGIAFSDPVDGAFFVIITHDGGNSWTRIPPSKLPPPLPNEAGFAASGTCLTVQGDKNVWFCTGGGAARVIFSNDKGQSWQAAETPIISGKSTQGAFSILFKDAMNGMIVGGNYKKENEAIKNAAYTLDGGKSWRLVEKQNPSGFRECAVYIPQLGHGFMITVGPSGCDFSQDNGRSWKPFSKMGFHSISVVPGHASAWAVGAKGSIARLN